MSNHNLVKPMGIKSYGSIPHILGSRLGPGDHTISEPQSMMCTDKVTSEYQVWIQTKLDGSCVAVYRDDDGNLIPLGRSGYPAKDSNFSQHKMFHNWVMSHRDRFDLIQPGQRLVGEWLAMAHGTIYDLSGRSPFVPFDLMTGHDRLAFLPFYDTFQNYFDLPDYIQGSCSGKAAMESLDPYGAEEPEGVIYRVEKRQGGKDSLSYKTIFLAKWVQPNKVDGKYFDVETWNYNHYENS